MIRGNRSRRTRQVALALVVGLAFIALGALNGGGAFPTGAEAMPQKEAAPAWNFGHAKSVSMPETGSQIRDRIVEARGEIGEGLAGKEAESESVQNVAIALAEARGQLEEILEASPAVRIKGHLFAAAQALPVGDHESVAQQLGSVEGELQSVPDWPSVEKVKEHVKAAREQLANGNAEAAFESLKAADDQVVLASSDRTAAETYYLVSVALAAVIHQDTTVALRALEAAQQSADAYVTAVTPAQTLRQAS